MPASFISLESVRSDGSITHGIVAVKMAITAEPLGAAAVTVNQGFRNKDIETIKCDYSTLGQRVIQGDNG